MSLRHSLAFHYSFYSLKREKAMESYVFYLFIICMKRLSYIIVEQIKIVGAQDEEYEDGRRERRERITNFHCSCKMVRTNGCTHILLHNLHLPLLLLSGYNCWQLHYYIYTNNNVTYVKILKYWVTFQHHSLIHDLTNQN